MRSLLDSLITCLCPTHCLLCHTLDLGKQLLCPDCEAELPFLKGPQCTHCAYPLPHSEATVCGACLKKTPAFDRTLALFEYQAPISHFITALKFNQELVYGKLLGDLFVKHLKNMRALTQLPECLIPIPLHPKRLRERGYNQALCIARVLAKALQLPLEYQQYQRHKATEAQSGLKAPHRQRNVHNAFSLRIPTHYTHVAIIDDVMTTGCTAQEFAHVLKKSGVKIVEMWCCARVL